jgi:hypothetical protein
VRRAFEIIVETVEEVRDGKLSKGAVVSENGVAKGSNSAN